MYTHCVIYPEGGIYRKIFKKSEEYARANNIPSFKHLALPHIKGIQVALNVLAPSQEDAILTQKGIRLIKKKLSRKNCRISLFL